MFFLKIFFKLYFYLFVYRIQFLRHLKEFFGISFKLEPYIDSQNEDLHQGYDSKILVTGVGIGYNKLV